MVIIETTIYLILIPDDDPGDDDENMSAEGTFHGLQQQSEYFGFLASAFCSHVVYLVNKVYCLSDYFFLNLYMCIKRLHQFSVHFSKRQMVIIETTFYLIFIPDDDPGDKDENMSAEGTFHGLQQQSILAS